MISSKSHCHNINDYATILRKRCNTVGQGNEIIPFHQKLKRVANNRQAGPQRWLSLPALFNEEQRLEDFTQCITGYTLRRARGEGTISSHCKDKIIITVSLAYQRVENVEHLDANNYIYLGSMKNVVSLQQGLTLDDNGHLLLIKGKSKNFLKQTWAKLHAGTKFYMARIELAKGGPCFFSRLRIDPSGRLIAEEKRTNVCYEINITTANASKSVDMECIIDHKQQIEITLKKTLLQAQEKNKIKLDFDRKASDEIYLSSDNLYLIERDVKTKERIKTKLNLPIPKKTKICSISKNGNHIKLSLIISGKKAVKYFSPEYVDKNNRAVTHLSHKPPQNLNSGAGDDPHEKVFSGQPFDEVRWSHFSSKNIPLISSVIDNFRVNVRRAKCHRYSDQKVKSGLAFADAIDPGVRCLSEVIGENVKRGLSKKTDLTDMRSKTDSVTRMKNFMEKKRLNAVFSLASDYIKESDSLAEKMTLLLSSIDENDSISLKNEKRFSCFFGVAAAGLPFVSGWFAGALARLMTHHSLTFSRSENNTICFNFIKRDTNSVILLAGTGQGMEEKGKLLSANNVDYGTVLPIEANIILVLNRESEYNFCFEIEWRHINEFLENLFNPSDKHQHIQRLLKKSLMHIENNKGLTLLAEAKSELRGQVGFMANSCTFLVLPRTALGLAGAVNFLALNEKQHEKISFDDNINEISTLFEKRYPNFSLALFRETKIMPIPMTGIDQPGQKIYCYPLPLIEESAQKLPYTGKQRLRHYRLNGTDLQLKVEPFASSNHSIPKESIEGISTDDKTQRSSEYEMAYAHNALYHTVTKLIDAIQEIIALAEKGEHGYQSIKPAKCISDFVISRGDYKKNLQRVKHHVSPVKKINTYANSKFTNVKRFVNSLKIWRKNTTLGEYLALKAKHIRVCHPQKSKGQPTAFDFITAIEKYAARCERDHNRKSATVLAIATYRLPDQTLKFLKEEFNTLSLAVKEKTLKGQLINMEYQRLQKLSQDLVVNSAGNKSRYRLNNIALVRQNAVSMESSTLPCTLLHVARRSELGYSKSLSSIKFEYREGEVFPYQLHSSLNIMPDMWY